MRLEIFVDKKSSKIYEVNKDRVLIGSGEGCDIILNTQGISRKHTLLLEIEGSIFVIDQGSTNGTYVGNSRIVPGNRVELPLFTTIRLGDNVIINSITESKPKEITKTDWKVMAKPASDRDKTHIISLKDLDKTKTESLVKKKKTQVAKSKTKPKQGTPAWQWITLMLILLGVSALYLRRKLLPAPKLEKTQGLTELEKNIQMRRKLAEEKNKRLKELESLTFTPVTIFENIDSLEKCSATETGLCDRLKEKFPEDDFKVINLGSITNVVTWNTDSILRAQELCRSGNLVCATKEEEFAGFLFFLYHALNGRPELIQKGLDYNFVFMQKNPTTQDTHLRYMVALKGEKLQEIVKILDEGQIKNLVRIGPVAATFAKDLLAIQVTEPYPKLERPTVQDPPPVEATPPPSNL